MSYKYAETDKTCPRCKKGKLTEVSYKSCWTDDHADECSNPDCPDFWRGSGLGSSDYLRAKAES